MITSQEVESLNLPSLQNNAGTCLLVESALKWVTDNTTLNIDINNLANMDASVKLFITKYIEIMDIPVGVTSESIQGLSQSFNGTDKNDLLISIARTLFGDEYVTAGKARFIVAENRWQ